jgi:hypothetical protein
MLASYPAPAHRWLNAREDSVTAETRIMSELGVSAVVSCNVVSNTKGTHAFVTVRAKSPVDAVGKEKIEAIVRRTFRTPVERVDLVI